MRTTTFKKGNKLALKPPRKAVLLAELIAEVRASGREPTKAELVRFEATAQLTVAMSRTADINAIATAAGVLDRLTRPSIEALADRPIAEPYDHEKAARELAELLGKIPGVKHDPLAEDRPDNVVPLTGTGDRAR